MIPFTEVAVMDRNSEYRGVPPLKLMENAGKSLAEELKARFENGKFLFVCGTGNNGGDAYVAARYLQKEKVIVYLVKGREEIRSEISRKNLDKLDCKVVDKFDRADVDEHVIVDGMLGTGISGKVREPYRSVIERINDSESPVVSIDVPSGLGADLAVKPDITVTFHDVKEGMNTENSGEIVIRDIGVPEKAVKYTGPGEILLYPSPKQSSHKGENGRLLVIGGGPYTGAPALVAKAAYRTGSDLVHLAVPSRVASIIAGYDPHLIVHPLKGDIISSNNVEKAIELAEECDAVVIGPGIGKDDATLESLQTLMENITIPKVIDADALMAVRSASIAGEAVLTPHKAEFRSMTGSEELSTKAADDFAADRDVTLILKGEVDYVTDGSRFKHNDFGSPTMTVGGTGDTLAGVVGALLSKGMSAFDAARLGVYITCRAGELASEEYGWGTLPGDIQEYIPKVID